MSSAKVQSFDSTKKEYMNIITSLMSFCVQGEHEVFCSTAVESLVKKLKGNREMLDHLYTAITTHGATPTKCVTIQRTLDSRLQIAGKKVYPHVITCKLWRWSNVVKNELFHTSCCEYAYQLKKEAVCVNPYHYKRTVSPEAAALSKLLEKNGPKNPKGAKKDSKQNKTSPAPPPRQFSNSPQTPPTELQYQQQPSPILNEYPNIVNNSPNYSPEFYYHELQNAGDYSNVTNNTNHHYNYYDNQNYNNYEQNYNNYERLDDMQQQYSYQQLLNPNAHDIYPIHSYEQNHHDLPVPHHRQNNYQITQLPEQTNYANNYSQYPNNSYWNNQINNTNNHSQGNLTNQLEHWCSINYYELKNLVGTFKVKSTCPMIRVDGYCEPDSEKRFCLGVLTNLERTEKSEKVRMSIGKGVCIEARANGDVYLKCETDVSIFLYSYYVDIKSGNEPGSKVHKLLPGEYQQIFDLNCCYTYMQKFVQHERNRMAATAAMVSGNSSPDNNMLKKSTSDINVDYLREFCVIRMSFAKGWGENYPKSNIKETPCWIEVSLHQALKLLDDILRQN